MKSLKFLRLFFVITVLIFTACEKDEEITLPKDGELLSKTAQLDPYLDKIMTKYDLMSLSAAIVKDDKLVWSKGYGYADKELKKNANSNTPYLIASISKTVTGVATMQLVERGKINLDADINTYLPFKITNPKNPRAVITCRHLLTHTSGIVDDYYYQVSQPALFYYGKDPDLSLADFCKAFFTSGGTYYNAETFAANAPGTSYAYSNIAFALLGYVVERAAQQPFDQFTKANIFTPLSMTRTSWRLKDFNLTDLAMPYDLQNKPYGHYTFADYPDGGLFTSVNDLSKYLRAFMQGGIWNGKRILSEASVKEMRKFQFPQVENAERQGLAWDGADFGLGKNLLGHLGAEQGTNTFMFFDQDTNVGIILFLNKDIESVETGLSLVGDVIPSLFNIGEKSK
jgi:CubicO group peptidase (beta-lactamase class C family)